MAANTASDPRDPAGYAFAGFVVDPVRRLVWRNAQPIAIAGKTFELLLILIRHRDRIVEKDELLSLIWRGTVVQENNLVRQISNLRRALGQRPEQHDVVVTISGRGYRFVATVVELDALPPGLVALPGVPPAAGDAIAIAAAPPMPPGLPAPPPAGSTRATAWVALAALAVTLGAGAYGLRPEPVMGAPRSLSQLTYGPGLQHEPTWAPDGARLAYAADLAGNSDIWIQSTTDPTPIRLTASPAADWQPDWSPDGASIAFRSERAVPGLYIVPVAGGAEQHVSDFGYRPRWSPDGARLLFDDIDAEGPRRSPYVVRVDGGRPEPVRPDLVDPLRARSAWRSITVAWHPDGRVSLLGRSEEGWQFVTAPLGGGAPVHSGISTDVAAQLGDVSLGRFAWARSGRYLFAEGSLGETTNVWRITIDPATLAWTRAERMTTAAGREGTLSVSADGQHLAFASLSETTRLWSFPYDATTGRLSATGSPVTSGGAGEFDAAVPPDGSRLAYRTLRINRQELWQHAIADGGDRLLLTSDADRITSPRWSSDGLRLAYARRPADSAPTVPSALAIFSPAEGRELRYAMAPSERIVPDDWSPDGRLLLGACTTKTQRRMAVCVTSTTPGGSTVALHVLFADPAHDLICQRFSPDQRWISFLAIDRGSRLSSIYVMPAAGGTPVPITTGVAYDDKPRWSGDGRTLFFLSDRSGMLNLWAQRFDPIAGRPAGDPVRVTTFDDTDRRMPPRLAQIEIGVSRDHVFLPLTETSGRIWILDHVDR